MLFSVLAPFFVLPWQELSSLGDYSEAYRGLADLPHVISDFEEAIRLDPVARSFRFIDLGNALRDTGQYDRALAAQDTAFKLEPTNAWILLDRGRRETRL
jgi:tetratricopeptide (TPR) repeat protein